MATNGKPKKLDPITQNRVQEFVNNIYSFRTELFRRMFDPRRDVDDECGYPRTDTTITAQEYQSLYDREAIAARVVEVLPKECWQVSPLVYEDESSEAVTEFEKAWDGLPQAMRGGSLYQDEAGSPIWEAMLKVDILSRIGCYGVMLLGLGDDDLTQPAKKAKGLRFIRCFPEAMATITKWDNSPSSPRFGQPNEYLIQFNDPREQYTGQGMSMSAAPVHWTRIIHVSGTSDQMGPNEFIHPPTMRSVLNRLLDLRKVYSGDAEAWWKNVLMKIFLETQPQSADADADLESLKDMMERFGNGLQPWGFLGGMTAHVVAPAVVDPTAHIQVQIEAICIKLGIPVRVFKGSERGELASSQDDAAWNDRLKARQHYCITPKIIIPFIDRLILLGILPTPKGYSVEWPDLTSQSDAERADIFVKRMTAFSTAISGGVENLIPPLDILTREAGYDEEEAEAILLEAEKLAEDKDLENEEMAAEQGFEKTPPPGFKSPEPPEEESEEIAVEE